MTMSEFSFPTQSHDESSRRSDFPENDRFILSRKGDAFAIRYRSSRDEKELHPILLKLEFVPSSPLVEHVAAALGCVGLFAFVLMGLTEERLLPSIVFVVTLASFLLGKLFHDLDMKKTELSLLRLLREKCE